jgi:hypothetical protein
MKWVKHMANANRDDKIVSLRASFGMWGIGVYWTLVELVAEQVKEKSTKVEATLIVSDLLGFFGCKRNKLETFLECSANVQLFTYELKENILKINIPKMLDYADNYIKYDGKSLKTLQRQEKMSSKHRIDKNRIDKKKSIKIYSETSFEIGTSRNLFNKILENDSKAKAPNFQRWAKEIDLLHRIDLRSIDEIQSVIDFCQADSFWKTNILSTEKLRKQFPRLLLQMKERKNGNNTKSTNPNSAIARATFKHGEAEKQRLRELQATIEERDRERNLRTGTDSK